jgi:hypothetical protein
MHKVKIFKILYIKKLDHLNISIFSNYSLIKLYLLNPLYYLKSIFLKTFQNLIVSSLAAVTI